MWEVYLLETRSGVVQSVLLALAVSEITFNSK